MTFPSLSSAEQAEAAELADAAVEVAQQGRDVEAWLRGWFERRRPPDQEQSLDSGD